MIPAHIARLDARGRYTFSNRRLPDVMPGRPAAILGMHISETLGADAFARVRPHLEAALREGRQSTFEFTDTLSSRRIRGVFTPDPLEPGVYILSQDVTEETQARAALQQTRRREMAAQLTSGLAHDFSNLLTIILGMQSRLQRMDHDREAQPLIEATLQAARRGGTLLERIADIASTRAWRPQPLALPDFLDDFTTLARSALPDAVALEVSQTSVGVHMLDAGMLQDALLNLVLNARDACGTAGRISLAVTELRETWLEFTVSDTGPGFSEQALAHGLDPFFTTKGVEGSGLGLAMVYDMTKLAGGEMRLANAATGARVTLRLPLRRASGLPASGLVLLVEDSADLRASIREMLRPLGFSVIEAGSVTEAAALVRGLPEIAMVLSDIALGDGETGLALLDRLGDKPLRLMTALPADHPLHEAALARVPVLAKPFTQSELAGFLGLGTRAA
jgi:signal transduction histidine kinase